eukprot:6212832-Pleurochrysis_carterae.AAC.3
MPRSTFRDECAASTALGTEGATASAVFCWVETDEGADGTPSGWSAPGLWEAAATGAEAGGELDRQGYEFSSK